MWSLRAFFLVVALSTSGGLFGSPSPFSSFGADAMLESDRLREYHKRNYTWPPTYKPDTDGWKKIMDRRFAQVEHIPDTGERYDGWIQTVTAAIVAPNFTSTGWGLTRAPEDLMQDLRKAIRDGLPNARVERDVDVIEGAENPLFVDRWDLTRRVLNELKPMHEAWSGVPLVGSTAYGFRLYRNQSALLMHVDKPSTHVISCILHIDSSEDAEPWPIVIEDYQGNTNEVILTSGDMLFYESSKCFHGRPKKFNGSWYSSIFVHYRPQDWSKDQEKEAHYAVPPHWNRDPPASKQVDTDAMKCTNVAGGGSKCSPPNEPQPEALKMVGTGMKEPGCPSEWCALAATTKMSGPGEKDTVITTGGRFPLWKQHDEL